jgi:hypothetical protein
MSEGKYITVGGNGIGLCGAIFIVFLVLKLVGAIGWSWWWVTAPLWIPTVAVLGILIIVVIIAALVLLLKKL